MAATAFLSFFHAKHVNEKNKTAIVPAPQAESIMIKKPSATLTPPVRTQAEAACISPLADFFVPK